MYLEEILFNDLEIFSEKGQFEHKVGDELSVVCNAPKDSSGIFLIR
jgi:hypothetical protein